MSKERRVVITGVGPMTAIGIGKEALWNSILKGETGVVKEEHKIDNEIWDSFYIHKVKGFDISKFNIDRDILEEIKSWKEGEEVNDLFYLMAVIKLALDDSGINYNLDGNRIGIILTHENPGLEQFISKFINVAFEIKNRKITKKDFTEKIHYACVKSAYELQTFMVLYHIVKTFGIHGYSLFINSACASGLYALETASHIIKNGLCHAVIIAAADHPGIYKYLWFKQLNIYSKDGKIKPFAKNSNGFVFGDGGVGLVLEDLDYAQKRGAHIYAEYLGGGFCLEGWKVTLPAIGKDCYKKALSQALESTAVNEKDIDLLVPHGVGTNIVDRYEAKTIIDVFGQYPKKPIITTFKPYVGHNLGGSALLETAILLIAMEKNIVPPSLNCEEIDPRIKIDLANKFINMEINTAIKMCCAFAGYDAVGVFRKLEK